MRVLILFGILSAFSVADAGAECLPSNAEGGLANWSTRQSPQDSEYEPVLKSLCDSGCYSACSGARKPPLDAASFKMLQDCRAGDQGVCNRFFMKVGIIGDFEQNVCYLAGGKACFDAFRRVWEPKLKAGQGLDVPRFIYSKLACQSGSAQACDAWKLSIKNEMTRFGQMCKPGLTKECSEAGYYYTIFGEYEKALKAFQQGCPPSADPKDCALFTQFLDRLNPKVPEQKKILSRGTAYLQKMTKSKQ